jgi:hypothetical protein
MGTVWDQASPSDFERVEALLRAGVDPKSAAEQEGFTCSALRRADKGRWEEALAMSREARGFVVDKLVEDRVAELDEHGVPVRYREDASDSMIQFHARRHQPAYGAQQLELTGGVEVRSDIAASIDRFVEAVAAATVRASERGGAELDAGRVERRGEGVSGVALARLAGTSEPA